MVVATVAGCGRVVDNSAKPVAAQQGARCHEVFRYCIDGAGRAGGVNDRCRQLRSSQAGEVTETLPAGFSYVSNSLALVVIIGAVYIVRRRRS